MNLKNYENNFESQEVKPNIPDGLFKFAINNIFDAFMITTAQKGYPIVYVNKTFTDITGYHLQECIYKSPSFLQGPKTDSTVLKRLDTNIANGENFHGESINYRKDGSEFVMEWRVLPYASQQGKVTHYFAIQQDVSELRAFQKK